MTAHQRRAKRDLSRRGVGMESVGLICAKGTDFYKQRTSKLLSIFSLFLPFTFMEQTKLGCNFYVLCFLSSFCKFQRAFKAAMAYLPQSRTRSWPSKVKLDICAKLVLGRLQVPQLRSCLRILFLMIFVVFYTIFRDRFFLMSFSSGANGLKR